ncbi:heme-binding protein [Enterovirga sp.]|uniref:GlcG/HbpS family heme-binding protein n=1 Tax=Enterovirga sp. TaxID=2026350 RepID=UPI002CBC6F0E|nr:heme-binding protein [Enterovirga sp.]HMO30714.1 heme-binding protein [Enterovirga sp.]
MASLTLAQASIIVEAALAEARGLGLAPMTVVVLDAGGHAVALKREDGSGILRVEIATGKAWGALGVGAGSRVLADRIATGPAGEAFVSAAAMASGGRLVPVAGGVLVRGSDGAVLGAVGVSGDLSDKDEACAVAGIRATGLAGDTGAKA